MNELDFDRLLALLGAIAGSLGEIARSLAPDAPNYKRHISQFATFDWANIGATIIKSDAYGPSQIEWRDQVYTRRSPENKFGEAIWFSRPDGKDADGNTRYVRLITFKTFGDAEPISRKAEAAAKQPADVTPAAVSSAAGATADMTADQMFSDLPSAAQGLPPFQPKAKPIGPQVGRQSAPAQSEKKSALPAVLGGGHVIGDFRAFANDFAQRHPEYRVANGNTADVYHILHTVAWLGIPRIEAENLSDVKERLEGYAATNP